MTRRLAGKVGLVFGAGPNIGGTVASAMARQGCLVAVCDRERAVAEETCHVLERRGHMTLALVADASVEAEVEAACSAVRDRWSRLDAVVNLAGRQQRCDILDLDMAAWDTQIASYLSSAALTTKHAARIMVERGGGSIIHITSDAAHQGEPGNSGYSAAKAAVLNFARAAAAELGGHGIRVNTLSPTYMEHNIWKYGIDEAHSRYRATAADFLEGIPLRRFCRAIDVAGAAVFLASDEAAFITGADIPLDGGARSRYWPWRPGAAQPLDITEYVSATRRTAFGEPSP